MEWYKGLWFKHHTPKFAFLAWLATLNRLSTGDRMVCWKNGTPAGCSLCSDPHETRNHLFFSCPFSAEIWRRLMFNLLGPIYTNQWDNIMILLGDTNQNNLKMFLLRYAFQISIHSIWCERNRRQHKEPITPIRRIVQTIDNQIRN